MSAELVGVSEVASRLKLTPERVRQLAKGGQLPPPIGSLGRQDVWRWDDVAVWAVAMKRLPEDAADGRQLTVAWLPGSAARRRLVVDSVENWGVSLRGLVHVRIWEGADSPAVVLLGNLDDNEYVSVTNRIEDVAMEIGARFLGSETATAQFYEHWSGGRHRDAEYRHVTFKVARKGSLVRRQAPFARQIGAALADPEWRDTDRSEVERLVGEPVLEWTAGTYTSVLVRAAISSSVRLGAVWDPDGGRDSATAFRLLQEETAGQSDAQVPAALLASLAIDAVEASATASLEVKQQDPDAAIWLVAPDLGDAADVVAAAAVDAPSAPVLWDALTWTRNQLRSRSDADRLSLVPAVRGGLARLPWHEAGLDEDPLEEFGHLVPVVRVEDLLTADQSAACPVEPLVVAERVLVAALEETGDREVWDVPAHRPSGPYRSNGLMARRYLDGVTWQQPDEQPLTADLADVVHRLRCQFYDNDATRGSAHKTGPTLQVGRDHAGNTAARSNEGEWFCVDWPIGRDALTWTPSRVVADPLGTDNAPVFVETTAGVLVPLPAAAGEHRCFEFTWGYSGSGPSNLRAALVQLLSLEQAASGGNPSDRFLVAAEHVAREHVTSAGTPNWLVSALLEKVWSTPARPGRRSRH